MSGINNIPIYQNGHKPEPIIPRQFDETCPHCIALGTGIGVGKIDNHELEFLYTAPSSDHILVYFRDEHGQVKYISVPAKNFKPFFE